MRDLAQQFHDYGGWRKQLIAALERYRAWLVAARLSDASCEERIASMLARLAQERMTVAFVAEYSRGKSELINAIFFSDYGQRILPSTIGRTTMCPTELRYDADQPPCIRLLPIETRNGQHPVSEYRDQPDAWVMLPLDTASVDGMRDAFSQVSRTQRVSLEEAHRYGLCGSDEAEPGKVDDQGMVEIPRWRHAIVNFPHPLLQQGLVIIDTPGLNAIGSEPELTLDLIPNAHVVLFVLATDTGVTRSDLEVWRDHIGAGPGRLIALNKIDGLWDELRPQKEVEMQIACQVGDVARILEIEPSSVFPVSAQKGLTAKVGKDAELLAKSRLGKLEDALAACLVPARHDIVRSQMEEEIGELAKVTEALLEARLRNVLEQLLELKGLRGKNRNIIAHMAKRIELEKRDFDASLQTLQEGRMVFERLSSEVLAHLGMETLHRHTRQARTTMQHSLFTAGMREAVRNFFSHVEGQLHQAGGAIEELTQMMTAIYRKFSTEHGLALIGPSPFTLDRYLQELQRIVQIYQRQFGTAAVLSTPQSVLMQQFFDTIAARVNESMQQASADTQAWLRALMSPLEAQVREHRQQLKERKDGIVRIHAAAGELEQKIEALNLLQEDLERQRMVATALVSELKGALEQDLESLRAAA